MTRRSSLTCLGQVTLGSLLLLAACADSGQTGSPVSTDPAPGYQSPGRKEPERPSGNTGGGGVDSGGESKPDAVPRPIPRPGSTALIGQTLVLADQGDLVLADVSTASTPSVLSHISLSADQADATGSSLLRADTLERLVVGVGLHPHGSGSEVPTGRLPYQLQEVWSVDASNPAAPRVLARSELPEDTLELAVRADGYTAFGASVAPPEQFRGRCGLESGPLVELVQVRPEALGLWLENFGPAAAAPHLRREFGAGHWAIASDQSHAIRLGLTANQTPTSSFAVELVDLATLETTFQTTLTPGELGTPLSYALGADYSNGVLVIAGGSRLLGFDTVSGQALPPVPTQGPVAGLHFIDGATLAVEGGGAPLVHLDRSAASPVLSLVPLAEGTPVTGELMPFGAGYLALDGTGGPTPFLRATSYALDSSGALALVDQLQTNWYYSSNWYNGQPWRIDRERERLSYTQPIDDSSGGRTGLLQGTAGQLSASDLVATEQMSPGPLLTADALLGFGRGVLQPIQIGSSGAEPRLATLPARTLLLEDVRFEVQHAGLIWARHRTDTGKTSLSVRADAHAEPRRVELPHAVDAILPIDASHVAVFGFSVDGMCEYWRETNPNDAWQECGPDAGNGVSVIAVDAGQPRVVRSIPLSSFLEGRPPPGIAQGISWQGYLPTSPGKWALWASFFQNCSSAETCATLGVPAYTSYGTSGCSSGQTCDTSTHEFVSGYLSESWLFPLDLSDPEAPVLERAVRSGARLDAPGYDVDADLAPQLLGYDGPEGQVWGYAVDEPLYDAAGESLSDGHGEWLHRWHVQLVGSGPAPSFGARINVPGQSVLLAPGTLAGGTAQHTVFTLEPRYQEDGEQTLWLHRLRVTDAVARIDQSLELGPNVIEARAVGERIAILSGSGNACAPDASYTLQVVDARDGTLQLSTPLQLPGEGYFWSLALLQREAGVARLDGGPAPVGGKLSVDLTSDPPAVLRYEY